MIILSVIWIKKNGKKKISQPEIGIQGTGVRNEGKLHKKGNVLPSTRKDLNIARLDSAEDDLLAFLYLDMNTVNY